MSPKSKKTRGHLACSRAASALGLAQTSPSPAGSIRPFCDPVMARSTFHSSMRKSIEPMELTPSTYSRAGCCAASIALRTAATSLVTPVAVSLWTMRIPLRSEEHTSELQSQSNLVCRLLLEKKKHTTTSVSHLPPRQPATTPHLHALPPSPRPAPLLSPRPPYTHLPTRDYRMCHCSSHRPPP